MERIASRRNGGEPLGSAAQTTRRAVEEQLRAWTSAHPTMREQLAQLAKERDVAVLKVEQQLHTINRFTKYDD